MTLPFTPQFGWGLAELRLKYLWATTWGKAKLSVGKPGLFPWVLLSFNSACKRWFILHQFSQNSRYSGVPNCLSWSKGQFLAVMLTWAASTGLGVTAGWFISTACLLSLFLKSHFSFFKIMCVSNLALYQISAMSLLRKISIFDQKKGKR